MTLDFDQVTGDYELSLSADPSSPFFGDIRININILNVDLGTTARSETLFSHVVDDRSITVPTTNLTATGNDPLLTTWSTGDTVYFHTIPALGSQPLPPEFELVWSGGGFRSGIWELPLDGFGLDNEDPINTQIAVVVPEPTTLLLVACGLLGLCGRRRCSS